MELTLCMCVCVRVHTQHISWEGSLKTVPSAVSQDSQRAIFNLVHQKYCFSFFVMTDVERFFFFFSMLNAAQSISDLYNFSSFQIVGF